MYQRMILCSIRHNGQYLSNWNRTQNLSKPIWLSDVECTGRETDIMQCRHTPWGRHNCDHSQDVWMSCFFDASRRYAGELISLSAIRYPIGSPYIVTIFCHVYDAPLLHALSLDRFPPNFPRTRVQVVARDVWLHIPEKFPLRGRISQKTSF